MAKPQWDRIESGESARLVSRLLRNQVRFQLFPFSPHYREALSERGANGKGFDGVEELKTLQCVERDSLARDPSKFILQNEPSLIQKFGSSKQIARAALDRLLKGQAAGKSAAYDYDPVLSIETSSKRPVSVALTRFDLATLALQGSRMLEVAGAERDDFVLNLLEPAASGGFWCAFLGTLALGLPQSAPGYFDAEQTGALTGAARATVLIGRALDLAAILEASHLPNLRLVVLGPEPIAPALRAEIQERAKSARVVGTYYFAEGRALWSECQGGAMSGYHLSPDLDLVEILERRSDAVAEDGTSGEVAFTGLSQRGTALMRYKPGDVATGGLHTGQCPYCGRSVARILGPIARAENLIPITVETERREIDAEIVAEVLAHRAVDAWGVEIAQSEEGYDEVYIHIRPNRGADLPIAMTEIFDELRRRAGFAPTQLVQQDNPKPGFEDRRPVPGVRLIIDDL